MPLILNIETSTTLCSVALAESGRVIASKEVNDGYTHAENLHVFILEVLNAADKTVKDLQAVACGRGPGSYTGLRIGVSAAKGLAFSLNIPLISVNTLQTMAAAAKVKCKDNLLLCPMLDARRMEVYTAVFDNDLSFIKETSAQIVSAEDISFFNLRQPIVFFGDGMPKCRTILQQITQSEFIENILPSANILAELSYPKYVDTQFEDVAYFEPFYLKDFLINGGQGN